MFIVPRTSLQYLCNKKKLKDNVKDEVDFRPVDKHQSFRQVDFNTLGIKDAYKVILSLLLGMIKHSQSNRFANIFTISQKGRNERSSFFACSRTSKFLQVGIIVFDCFSMFIVTCFLAQPGCRTFLPECCNTIIKQQLRG